MSSFEKAGVFMPLTRLLEVQYSLFGRKNFAIAVEHIEDMAQRNGGDLNREPFHDLSSNDIDRASWWTEQLAMRLVGADNGDRSYRTVANVFWVDAPNGKIPVPYDFEISSMINIGVANESRRKISHALWEDILGAEMNKIAFVMNVAFHKMREHQVSLQEGCQDAASCDAELLQAIESFQEKKDTLQQWITSAAILEDNGRYAASPMLDREGKELALQHLDIFFEVLEDKKFLQPMTTKEVMLLDSASEAGKELCTVPAGTLVQSVNPLESPYPTWVQVRMGHSKCKKAGWIQSSDVFIPPTHRNSQ